MPTCKKSREEGRKCGVYFFYVFLMQLSHECIKIWTTQNKHDRMTQINHSLGIFKIFTCAPRLGQKLLKGKIEKQQQPPAWNSVSQPWVTEAEDNNEELTNPPLYRQGKKRKARTWLSKPRHSLCRLWRYRSVDGNGIILLNWEAAPDRMGSLIN